MKTAVELSEGIVEAREKIDGIVNMATREERELSAAEAKQVDELLAKIETDEEDRERRHKLDVELKSKAAQKFGHLVGGSPKGGSAGWQEDARGNRYAVLNKGDKAADLMRPQCKNQFGHFVLAGLFGASRATPEPVKMSLSESQTHLGGILVPDRLSGEVIDLARAKSVLMQAGTRTIPMQSQTLTIPKLVQDVTVDTHAENETITATDLQFGSRLLNTYTAAALTKISRELWQDSPELLAEQLESWLAAAMALKIDTWGLSGSGSQEPVGLLNAPGISSTGTVGAIDWTDVSAAATAIRNSNHEPNSAIMDTTIAADLLEIETGDGTNSARGWLGAPPTLANVAMLNTTHCPTAKAVLGDFNMYAMGVRTGALVEASTVAGDAMEKHQIWVKITQRFDFVTLDDSAFHILEGITT